ncbi:DUF1178 family protein [Variovorax sp. PCZ-1]|uniref:DUF1178 family protein n=1 Tax=Variovorax sp. PCZ-1 TaxID=2835533 RepID=UPI001BCE9D6B|nr:DUF1178 family protein [Variovorax sp. PCZ-1]MBS7807764.1 DUF1178 family protein [Variovorax sp. PCZ-1]
MKVLDLACQHGHGFEGWFGSEEDFQSQLARGLVQCPICDDAQITKKLSAPRLNLRSTKDVLPQSLTADEIKQQNTTDSIALRANYMPVNELKSTENSLKNEMPEHPMHALMRNPEFQAAYMQMAKEVLAKTEDVGDDFAREARKIHYGEAKERGIRGQASHDETLELLDEGIDVMPLPLPKALKGTLQ